LETRTHGTPVALSVALTLLAGCGRTNPPALEPAHAVPTALADSAVVARGRYLVNGPAHCVACHTPAGPLTPVDPERPPSLVGGYGFAVPGGTVRAPNLTPDPETGIGRRSDPDPVRALRFGRRPDGRALLPYMGYQGMSDEDPVAVLSYLRTLTPIRSAVPVHDVNVLGRILIGLVVQPHGPSARPARRSPVGPAIERGEYLTKHVALCVACHTRRSRTGGFVGGRFAGGFPMPDDSDPSRELVTPNLTPDPETGHIAHWTEDALVARFRAGRLLAGSPMPWASYALMRETDLRSIYRYLASLPPVRRPVRPTVSSTR
jgi:mono/diheme cytochrome c family protein